LNLAALWGLPIVFLVINNDYGMGTSVERASAEPEIYRRAAAFRMHGERVDGDDIGAVREATTRLLERARGERLPAVLEALTYRYRGHSVADAGLAYRSREEIAAHRARDPLTRIRSSLLEQGASESDLEEISRAVSERITEAVRFAEQSPAPEVGTLAKGVYSSGSFRQFERMMPGSPFGERELVFAGGLGR